MFQCAMCKRHYKRLDHLARHVRSREYSDRTRTPLRQIRFRGDNTGAGLDTQSKPYKCHLCPKAFGRA